MSEEANMRTPGGAEAAEPALIRRTPQVTPRGIVMSVALAAVAARSEQ